MLSLSILIVLNCQKCDQCLKGHKSLGSLFSGCSLNVIVITVITVIVPIVLIVSSLHTVPDEKIDIRKKWPSEGRWYAPTCVTPGVTARGHSINQHQHQYQSASESLHTLGHHISQVSLGLVCSCQLGHVGNGNGRTDRQTMLSGESLQERLQGWCHGTCIIDTGQIQGSKFEVQKS